MFKMLQWYVAVNIVIKLTTMGPRICHNERELLTPKSSSLAVLNLSWRFDAGVTSKSAESGT